MPGVEGRGADERGGGRDALTNDWVAQAHVRYRSLVERAAARILGNREDARDVASETFLALIERGPREEPAVAPWLVTSAKNRARNRVRDRARAGRHLFEIMAAPSKSEPEREVGNRQAVALVLRAAERLPERYRIAIEMRVLEDLPYSSLATALDCSSDQARVVLHRAQSRLRREVVLLLADQHGVPKGCRRRLGETAPAAGHACAPCSAVADEMAALTMRGIFPLAGGGVPLLQGVLRGARSFVRISRVPLGDRIAEAAALLLLVSSAVFQAPAESLRAPPTKVAAAVTPSNQAAASAVGREGPVVRSTIEGRTGLIVHRDPARDSSNGVGRGIQGLAAALSSLVQPDALATSGPSDLDIREFAIWTEPDRQGRPAVLHMQVTLADFPYSLYSFEWTIPRDRCRAYLHAEAPPQSGIEKARLDLQCPARERPWGVLPPSDTTRTTIHEVPIRFGPRTVDLFIPFSRLDGAAARVLRPGTILSRLRSSTSSRDPFQLATDAAPDEGGLSYQIPK